MALSVVGVQGSRQQLGNMWVENYLVIPGTSDYVVGGYLIGIPGTASANGQVSMSLIQGVQILGVNSSVAGSGATPNTYLAFPVFSFVQLGTGGSGEVGYKSFLFMVTLIGGSATEATYIQPAVNTNLSGLVWEIAVTGY